MNERIKQLAEQAGISLSQKDFSYYWVESVEDMEKFAELIVEECMSNLYLHGYDDARAQIKQHFGVEE